MELRRDKIMLKKGLNVLADIYSKSYINKFIRSTVNVFKNASKTFFAAGLLSGGGNFVRHSVSFQSIRLPYLALQKTAERSNFKSIVKESFFENVLSSPFNLPLSFYGAIFSGYFFGRGFYILGFLALPLILINKSFLELYKNSFLSNLVNRVFVIEEEQKRINFSKKYTMWGFALAFLIGFITGEVGIFIILSIFVLASPEIGIYLTTSLCMFTKPQNICILALVTVYAYISKTAFYKGVGRAPRSIDVFVYIFTLLVVCVMGAFRLEVALITASFLLYYMTFTGLIKNRRLFRNVGIVFILSATISALGSIFNYNADFSQSLKSNTKAFGEFYMLTIPFAFAFVTDTKKAAGTVCLTCGLIMCIALLVNLSKGTLNGSVLALAIFLCIRDVRYLWPTIIGISVFLALIFGNNTLRMLIEKSRQFQFGFSVFASIRQEILVFSLMAILILGASFYIQTKNVQNKGPLIRSMTAAASSGGFGILAQSIGGIWDEYRLVFVFWIFLSLFSVGIEIE